MTAYHQDDRVAFTLGGTNYIGNIREPNDTGDNYIVDTPAGAAWFVDADMLIPVPPNTIAVKIACNGTITTVRHDRDRHAIDVICDVHGRVHTYLLDRGATENEKAQTRHDASASAAKHTSECTTTSPGVATTGGQQP